MEWINLLFAVHSRQHVVTGKLIVNVGKVFPTNLKTMYLVVSHSRLKYKQYTSPTRTHLTLPISWGAIIIQLKQER